jgi:hypothetical protein
MIWEVCCDWQIDMLFSVHRSVIGSPRNKPYALVSLPPVLVILVHSAPAQPNDVDYALWGLTSYEFFNLAIPTVGNRYREVLTANPPEDQGTPPLGSGHTYFP